jgi:hypothetical protein
LACAENPCEHPQGFRRDSIQDNTAADRLARLSVLGALMFALRLSVATFAENKSADKPGAAEGNATKEGAGKESKK